VTWVPSGPDLDPALVRAAALAPHLHTPQIADALTRHTALRTALRTAHTIDTRLTAVSNRNRRDQGTDRAQR
jgi:hypothetical protein